MMGGDGGTAMCGTCSANEVCCPSGKPCAGMCVPNCNHSSCPSGLMCDAQQRRVRAVREVGHGKNVT